VRSVSVGSGEIAAVAVTRKDIDDAALAGALLGQILLLRLPAAAIAIRTGFTRRSSIMIPMPPSSCRRGQPRCRVPRPRPPRHSVTHHLRMITKRGRMTWQKASGYNLRARVGVSIGRYKRVIGDALRSRTDQRRRSCHRCRYREPDAGARTPELRPYR
jgi:hypothetical protein